MAYIPAWIGQKALNKLALMFGTLISLNRRKALNRLTFMCGTLISLNRRKALNKLTLTWHIYQPIWEKGHEQTDLDVWHTYQPEQEKSPEQTDLDTAHLPAWIGEKPWIECQSEATRLFRWALKCILKILCGSWGQKQKRNNMSNNNKKKTPSWNPIAPNKTNTPAQYLRYTPHLHQL